MIVSKDNGSSYCFARIVPNLDDTKKKICVLPLLSSLMSCGSFTGITSEMCQSLINIDNKDIQKDIVKATLPYLKMPDPRARCSNENPVLQSSLLKHDHVLLC